MAHDKGGGFSAGLIVGGIIGVAIGLLFAPKPGEKTRQRLGAKVRELVAEAQEFLEEEAAISEAVEEGETAAAQTGAEA